MWHVAVLCSAFEDVLATVFVGNGMSSGGQLLTIVVIYAIVLHQGVLHYE